jgi:hypothetical protein
MCAVWTGSDIKVSIVPYGDLSGSKRRATIDVTGLSFEMAGFNWTSGLL